MAQLRGQDTIVDSSLMETSSHGTETFPFALYLDDFSCFKNEGICWHWHDQAQITLITEGDFVCQLGSEKLLMHPGDLIFINSRALHQIYPLQPRRGKLYAFLWRPELLGAPGSDLYENCIVPITASALRCAFYPTSHAMNRRLYSSLMMIVKAAQEKSPFHELHICAQLSRIWLHICEHCSDEAAFPDSDSFIAQAREEERVKQAMRYIQENFSQKLSLDSIAQAAMTNRSELCRCFRRVLDLTPGEFVLQYRLERALSMLEDPHLHIAEIAESCGFCSPSHFGSQFAKHLGCTPLQYRKNLLG